MNPLNRIPAHFFRGINESGVPADHFPDAVTKRCLSLPEDLRENMKSNYYVADNRDVLRPE